MDPLVILYVFIGVSLVIFVHELGHFAVAKWAGVKVEKFSIGFPMPKTGYWAIPAGAAVGLFFKRDALTSGDFTSVATWIVGGAVTGLVVMLLGKIGSLKLFRDKDDTEYVFGFMPVGGYVKMLGENPEEEVEAETVDPRSYAAQPVYKRMMIISAGVVMNIIFAFIWFVIAYNLGVSYTPTVIRKTIPGSSAWKGGLRPGDEIVQINSIRDPSFDDLMRTVALADPGEGGIHLKGIRANGERFEVTLVPEQRGILPQIGVLPQSDTRLAAEDPAVKGMSAEKATPPFEGGDRIVEIDGESIENFAALEAALDRARGETVAITVERKKPEEESEGEAADQVEIEVGPNHFRTLGIQTQMGEIAAIKTDSPAAGRLEEGDIITQVNGRELGKEIDPLRFPDELFALAGEAVQLTVKRRNEEKPIQVELTPEPYSGWSERPFAVDDPLPAPALGIAYRVVPVVLSVEPDSPAAQALIQPTDRITSVKIISDDPNDGSAPPAIPLTEDDEHNWPFAFWLIQTEPGAKVELTLAGAQGAEDQVVTLTPETDLTWPLPMRGLAFEPLTRERKTANLIAAARLGLYQTWDSLTQVYLMLRRIFSGQISPKALGGPITIVTAAGRSAEKGIPDLLVFLALFSANLAVLNFLPIPVLDGGHMIFLIWEAIRGKPADERAMIVANYVGLAMLVCLMLYVFVLDLDRLFNQ